MFVAIFSWKKMFVYQLSHEIFFKKSKKIVCLSDAPKKIICLSDVPKKIVSAKEKNLAPPPGYQMTGP